MKEGNPQFSQEFIEEFEQLLCWRRDVRSFKTTALEPGLVDELLEKSLRYSPSVGNAQPWRIVRVEGASTRKAVRAHVESENKRSASIYDDETAAHYAQLKLHGLDAAPEQLAVFSVIDPEEGKGLGRQTMNETLTWSTVMAIHTLWLMARANGIGLGWVSILQPDKMNQLLDCPAEWRFIGYFCLGIPKEESETPDLVKAKWQERLPTEQLIYKI